MKTISNADYDLAIRLLQALSKTKGNTIREKENARKAGLLFKKLSKKKCHKETHEATGLHKTSQND